MRTRREYVRKVGRFDGEVKVAVKTRNILILLRLILNRKCKYMITYVL